MIILKDLYSTKLEKSKRNRQFFDKYYLSKLNKSYMNNLNKLITLKEQKHSLKFFKPKQKLHDKTVSTQNFARFLKNR